MSFLKQLLTPFIDFDEEEKKKAVAANTGSNTNPAAGKPGQPAQVPGQATGNPTQPTQQTPVSPAGGPNPVNPGTPANQPLPDNTVHPLVTGSTGPTQALKQVPVYSQDGTITGPMPEHEEYFERLIAEANAKNPLFQGTDYKEFIDSKIDIDDIADEAIKYRTAFNILKSSGLTKEKLLSTGQEYLNVIGRDLNAFQGAHSLQYQKEVRQKEQLIDKKVQELQALTIKLNELKKEINQATSEINLIKEKLNTTKNSFLLAGEKKQNEIQTELEKIAHYF
ncbi:hypothetical protein ACX0G7_18945 [Flavitalea antarctica]